MTAKDCAADPDLWVVEWSADQHCIHIERLGDVLKTNRSTALKHGDTGFVPLAIFETQREAEDFAHVYEPRLRGN